MRVAPTESQRLFALTVIWRDLWPRGGTFSLLDTFRGRAVVRPGHHRAACLDDVVASSREDAGDVLAQSRIGFCDERDHFNP